MVKRGKIVQAGVFLFILLCAGASIQCRREEEATAKRPETSEYPVQEGWNSELYISRAGRKQAVVHYGHMQKFENREIIYFDQGVAVDFFDETGMHASHLTAERGEYNETSEDVRGMGNVVVESDSGVTLWTEALSWDNARGKILSDTLVRITTQSGDTLYGMGFESNADLSRRVIRKPWGVAAKAIDLDALESSVRSIPEADSADGDSSGNREGTSR